MFVGSQGIRKGFFLAIRLLVEVSICFYYLLFVDFLFYFSSLPLFFLLLPFCFTFFFFFFSSSPVVFSFSFLASVHPAKKSSLSYGLRDCETASATPLTCWGTPPTDSSEFALACLRRKNKWRWVQNGRLWWPWKDRQHKKLDALTVFHRGSTCRWWLGSYQEQKTPKMIGVACAYIQTSMLDGELSENIRQTYIHIHVHAFIHTYIHYMTMYSYSTRTHG